MMQVHAQPSMCVAGSALPGIQDDNTLLSRGDVYSWHSRAAPPQQLLKIHPHHHCQNLTLSHVPTILMRGLLIRLTVTSIALSPNILFFAVTGIWTMQPQARFGSLGVLGEGSANGK